MKKIILIGSEGILGSFYKKKFLNNDCFLVVGDKNLKSKNTDKFVQEKINLEDENSINSFFLKIKKYGKFDVIINNAAYTTEGTAKNNKKLSKDFVNFDFTTWEKTIKINLTGVFLSCQNFIRHFHDKDIQQKIINIGSIYGSHSPHHNIYEEQNFFSNIAYTSSKAGLIGLTKWLATKYINEKTNVNIISPAGVFNKHNSKFLKDYLDIIPIDRMAKPDDIYGMLEFLISEKSNYITGQNFHVDGGFSAW